MDCPAGPKVRRRITGSSSKSPVRGQGHAEEAERFTEAGGGGGGGRGEMFGCGARDRAAPEAQGPVRVRLRQVPGRARGHGAVAELRVVAASKACGLVV